MSAGNITYVDTSALAKLVVVEAESGALRAFLRTRQRRASSAVARVELERFARRHGPQASSAASGLLSRIYLLALDEALLRGAVAIEPVALRSLDAIHLAAALSLGPELAAVVTYDRRMREAAEALGLLVEAPA